MELDCIMNMIGNILHEYDSIVLAEVSVKVANPGVDYIIDFIVTHT